MDVVRHYGADRTAGLVESQLIILISREGGIAESGIRVKFILFT
jgi:hypothetical protein